MNFSVFKMVVIVLLSFCVAQCSKEKFESEKGTDNSFDEAGRVYTFEQSDLASSIRRNVIVQIPAGAVGGKHSLLYNSFQLSDYNSLSGYYIDFYLSDINYFVSSSDVLSNPATLILPYRNSMNWVGYGYSIFHVNVQPEDLMFTALNDTTRWTAVPPPYTVDNTAKTVSFQTTNLNGVYVVAKAK